MGILNIGAELLFNEHKYKKISGNLLSIGKQLNTINYDNLLPILEKYKIDKQNFYLAYKNEKDTTTRHTLGNIYDHTFYSCFADIKYRCADISSYEGADLIHDFSKPIAKKHYNKFDFIVNFSSMDNMFDPATFLRNTSKMLDNEGRILHLEVAGNYPGAYLMYTPEYFFSYYAINNFKDCKVYLFVTRGDYKKSRFSRKYDIFSYSPYFTRSRNYHHLGACKTIPETMYVLVVAEKQKGSTADKIPMQMQFLQKEHADWRNKYKIFCKNKRPVMKFLKRRSYTLPYYSNHFTYLGSY
jgi:hypothetical protein